MSCGGDCQTWVCLWHHVHITLHPRTRQDLLLAPIAVAVDENLAHLRDRPPAEIAEELAIHLNTAIDDSDRAVRARLVLEDALRFVDLHEWQAQITDDAARLRLSGGSVTLDLGLSASLTEYIVNGA